MHPIGMANLVFRLGLDGNTPHVKRIYFGSHDNSMFGRGASSPGRGNVDGSIPGSPPGPPPGPRFNDAKSSTKFIEGAPPYAAPGASGFPPIDACGAIPGPDPIDIGGGAPAPTGAAGIGDIGGGTAPIGGAAGAAATGAGAGCPVGGGPYPPICVGGAPIGGDGAFICIGGAPMATPPPICIGGIAPVAGAPVAGGAAENPPDPICPPPRIGGAPYPPIAGARALIPGAPIATGGAPTPPPTIGGAPLVIVGGARAPPVVVGGAPWPTFAPYAPPVPAPRTGGAVPVPTGCVPNVSERIARECDAIVSRFHHWRV